MDTNVASKKEAVTSSPLATTERRRLPVQGYARDSFDFAAMHACLRRRARTHFQRLLPAAVVPVAWHMAWENEAPVCGSSMFVTKSL